MSKTLSGDEVYVALRTRVDGFAIVLLRDTTTKNVFVDIADVYDSLDTCTANSRLWLTTTAGIDWGAGSYDYLFCIPSRDGKSQLNTEGTPDVLTSPETTTDRLPRLTSIEFANEFTNQENDYFGEIQKAYIPIVKNWTMSFTYEPFGPSFDSLFFGVLNYDDHNTRAAHGLLATITTGSLPNPTAVTAQTECFEWDIGNAQYGLDVALIFGSATCPPWEEQVAPSTGLYEVFRGEKACISTASMALNARGTNQLSVTLNGAIGYITGCTGFSTMFE